MSIKRTIIAISIMLVTSISLTYFKNSEDQPLKRRLSEFPTKVEEWQGTISRFDDKIYEILGVDDLF